MSGKQVLIQVNNLSKHFNIGKNKILRAVDDVSFHIYKGETLGLVGESGCGKSTVGRTLLQIYESSAGEIYFDGQKLNAQAGRAEQAVYKQNMQMIFQDPYSSLNARMTVLEIVSEGLLVHRPDLSFEERKARVFQLLELVGLQQKYANRYPHEFSGGQRQRIGIARALAVEPKFIVADEPIAALDVSIQAQIVNLLKQLQKERGLTYLFIAHDLSMVKYISDRIAVMYVGQFVELAESETLYRQPLHPYTEALLSSIPLADPKLERSRERILLKGDVPNPASPPSGCRFRTRCPKIMDICKSVAPVLREVEPNHFVSCHLFSRSSNY